MGFLKSITDFVGGSLFGEIKDTVMSYFPPDMTPEEKMQAELQLQQFLHAKEVALNSMVNEAAAQLDKRIAEQEGTASDLKSIPIIGSLMLFLRGSQRPAWGFATMYMDTQWLFSDSAFTEQQELVMIIINMLVLGFLFGERAVKNLEPMIMRIFDKILSK